MWLTALRYWYLGIIGLLLASNVFVGWQYYDTQLALVKEQASHTKDIQNFKSAQELANARAEMIKANLQKEAQANADKADANYLNLLAKYNASILRYKANQSGASSTPDNQLPATQSGNRPSTSTELSITLDDAQICAVNTARLQSVHDWAVALPK